MSVRTVHFGMAILFLVGIAAPAGVAEKEARAGETPVREALAGSAREAYFPPPESKGGWRKLDAADDIRRLAGMDPAKLDELKAWLAQSDDRDFAAVVIRRGYIVLEVERGNSAKTDARRVASVSKAVCATVLAIASEQSRQGLTPRKMSFDDRAFDFIPWAQPLSDPRKSQITVKQLLNHTSGICPEATGAPNDGSWEYILGHTGDPRTATLAFDPGKGCGYSTHGLDHASLVCETVTGKPYDRFAIEALFEPLGIEHWWFQYFDGGEKIGRHPSHGLGMPARDLARIAYCMARDGRWGERQVVPKWFVDETATATHQVRTPEMRWKLNPQVFSHGWELPARHDPASGRSGEGIPADARSKPGSGGQLIAFVPSLDLVVTRQTGGSGEWGYDEYLRRACAAVESDPAGAAAAESSRTSVAAAASSGAAADSATGLAARYPNDAGLAADPNVVFADDFEQWSADGLEKPADKWHGLRKNATSLTHAIDGRVDAAGKPGPGHRILEIACRHAEGQSQVGGLSLKLGNFTDANEGLGDGHDDLYIRYYVKFDENYRAVRNHGPILGGRDLTMKDAAWPGMAGIRDVASRGYFATNVEPQGKLGGRELEMNFYSYHMDKKGPWGDNYEIQKRTPIEVGSWHCIERHIRLTSVVNGQAIADGLEELWIDGERSIRKEGLRFRRSPTLKVTLFSLETYYHGLPAEFGEANPIKVYFDNVVIARRSIGPLARSATP
jgi:CubicO group peptidase (beta-lactamase class C family)